MKKLLLVLGFVSSFGLVASNQDLQEDIEEVSEQKDLFADAILEYVLAKSISTGIKGGYLGAFGVTALPSRGMRSAIASVIDACVLARTCYKLSKAKRKLSVKEKLLLGAGAIMSVAEMVFKIDRAAYEYKMFFCPERATLPERATSVA